MLGSMIGKVVWIGRATVFLVGLAVILALLFGAASTALGANGNPLILGKAGNTASKITGLVRSSAGPALRLKVDSGPPMEVNSAMQVLNLNADYVDGRSASSFVANSTYRLGSGQERVGTEEAGGKVLSQSCLPGDRLLSGGPASVNAASHVLDSFAAATNTWQVRINDSAVAPPGDSFTVIVLCADQ